VLYPDPVDGYPKSYVRDDLPKLTHYPGGQTLPTPKGDLMIIAIASGSEETTPSRSIFPVRSTMQIAVSFNDTSSPT
jgi:hypothetical protein